VFDESDKSPGPDGLEKTVLEAMDRKWLAGDATGTTGMMTSCEGGICRIEGLRVGGANGIGDDDEEEEEDDDDEKEAEAEAEAEAEEKEEEEEEEERVTVPVGALGIDVVDDDDRLFSIGGDKGADGANTLHKDEPAFEGERIAVGEIQPP